MSPFNIRTSLGLWFGIKLQLTTKYQTQTLFLPAHFHLSSFFLNILPLCSESLLNSHLCPCSSFEVHQGTSLISPSSSVGFHLTAFGIFTILEQSCVGWGRTCAESTTTGKRYWVSDPSILKLEWMCFLIKVKFKSVNATVWDAMNHYSFGKLLYEL